MAKTAERIHNLIGGKSVGEVLRTWRTMDEAIKLATEDQLNMLLSAEKLGQGRRLFLQRLYGRMSKLRAKREAAELREAAKNV